MSLEFLLTQSLRPHYGTGVDSASNRNRNISWGLKAAGATTDYLTTFMWPIFLKFGSLNLLEPSEPVRASTGIALPFSIKMNVKKRNVYLPSLVMKVPDHVYVLNDMHSSNTFQSVSFSVCQHETVITCFSTDCICSVFPHPCRNPCPHMRIRNE
jgi:hypothetical protein